MFQIVSRVFVLAWLGLIIYTVVLATRLVSAVERIASSLPPPREGM